MAKLNFLYFIIIVKSGILNSQATARKSNPQAPVSLCAAISVKERSHSFKISTKVFAGAENHKVYNQTQNFFAELLCQGYCAQTAKLVFKKKEN